MDLNPDERRSAAERVHELFLSLIEGRNWLEGLGIGAERLSEAPCWRIYLNRNPPEDEAAKLQEILVYANSPLPNSKAKLSTSWAPTSHPYEIKLFEATARTNPASLDESLTPPPIHAGKQIRGGGDSGYGTLGAILIDVSGKYFGVTCAHVVGKPGGEPSATLEWSNNEALGTIEDDDWLPQSTGGAYWSDSARIRLSKSIVARCDQRVPCLFDEFGCGAGFAQPGRRIVASGHASRMANNGTVDSVFAAYRAASNTDRNVVVTTSFFCKKGDSGAVVFEPSTRAAVGLVFHAFGNRTLINDIDSVLRDLKLVGASWGK